MRARKHLLIPERVAEQWRPRKEPTALARWPRCVLCNAPVEAYGIDHKGSKSWVIVARCHGYVEHQEIRWDHWSDAEPDRDTLRNHIASMQFFRPEHWETDS